MTATIVEPQVAVAGLPTARVCAGCGYRAPAGQLAMRCPNADRGDDIDHVVARVLDVNRVAWPAGGEANPFVRYRTLFHWYHVARAAGRTDAEVVDEIERLDDAVARVDGHGFRITPFARADALSDQSGFLPNGGVWVKDETGNVAGSHKARHLFGTLLALDFAGEDDAKRPLAIASCGNAALAAAVVARAAQRELLVFVPVDADSVVVGRLRELGAQITVCERGSTETGDPTVLRMREQIARGAVPFTCQGNENGIAIEGGLTLGYEMVDALRDSGERLDHLVIQVGGGALASSLVQSLRDARALGVIDDVPRIYTVQTRGVAPLARAMRLIEVEAGQRSQTDTLSRAARHRSRYMRPWWPVVSSVATGILDDETYDWLAVVRGMLTTGGLALTVDEDELRVANALARSATRIDVDATGSAGLSGLLQLRLFGEIQPTQKCAVLFTGIRRDGGKS